MILYPYYKISQCTFKDELPLFQQHDITLTDTGVRYKPADKMQPMSFYDHQRKEEIYDVRKSSLYNLSIATSYENDDYTDDGDYAFTLWGAKEKYDDEDNELFLSTFGTYNLLKREHDIYHANL